MNDVLEGRQSQFLSAGMEWQPWSWLALRGGAYDNIAGSEPPVYTLGAGIKLWRFYMDLAGSVGFSDVKVSNDTIGMNRYVPERANFMFTMGIDIAF